MKTEQTWYVILNPAAGKGACVKRWQQLKPLLDERAISYAVQTSAYHGHISELASAAVDSGYRRFISIGGDGTHHGVVNGILGTGNGSKCTVALLSTGSGNDWVKMHGISDSPVALAQHIAQYKTILHPAGLIRYQRDGQEHQRYFVNVVGMAMDGRVVETYPNVFRKFQFLPGYLIAGLWELIRYRPPHITVECSEQTVSSRMHTVHVGIGKYTGGGMQFVPHADPANQELAVTCIRQMGKLRLLGNLLRLYNGTLLSHPRVSGFTCQSLQIRGDRVPIETDGEFLGYSPATLTCIPEAFRLIVP